MIDLLGWLALGATCLAAVMTAANLGPRVTGYGFAIFFVGALAWCAVGAATGQRQLFWSNMFLAVIDLLGIWRWLYRRARADDAVARVKEKQPSARPALFSVDEIIGKPLHGRDDLVLGKVEGALADCDTGALRFLIVRPSAGDAGAGFKRLAWHSRLSLDGDSIRTDLTPGEIAELASS